MGDKSERGDRGYRRSLGIRKEQSKRGQPRHLKNYSVAKSRRLALGVEMYVNGSRERSTHGRK